MSLVPCGEKCLISVPMLVLLVLASELYDESDYIRNNDEFLDYVKNCGDTESAEEGVK